VWLVVHVKPIAACCSRLIDYCSHQPCPDPTALPIRVNGSVEQEGVRAAIPACMNETDELLIDKCADPGQAVTLQPQRPRYDARQPVTERSGVQRGELLVDDRELDLQVDCRTHDLSIPGQNCVLQWPMLDTGGVDP